MAYATPPQVSAGSPPTAAQFNLVRSDFEEVAKAPLGWVSSSTNQTVTNGTGPTVTLATTIQLHNVTFASNTLTIGETGMYIGVVRALWGPSTAGIRVAQLNVNGTSQWAEHITPGAPANWSQMNLATPFIAAAGDAITASVFQDSGGSLALLAGSSLFIKLVSRL